jgi:alpha,alpha-trehalose phosphorylase
MGGLWQAFTAGFCGVRARRGVLVVDPRLPNDWGSVTARFCFRTAQVSLRASSDQLELSSSAPIDVHIPGIGPVHGRSITARRTDTEWSST